MVYQVNIYMAFGLNVDFNSIIGNITNNLKSIAASKIQNLSSMVKTNLISQATGDLFNNIQGLIGSSLNLNLSKLTGSINFANGLKGLPFPSLAKLNLSSLYGIIDENIGVNLNKFTKTIIGKFNKLSLDDISLGNKLNAALDAQLDDISGEIEAGIIAGKSSLNVISDIAKLSNTQIRDFTFSPGKQLAFVNSLVQQQKDKIFDLSFNGKSETSIYNTQVTDISSNSVDSFTSTTFNPNFSFLDAKFIDETSISKDTITEQQFKLTNITEVVPPVARNVNIVNRFDKEEETLNYLETFNDDFVASEVNVTRSISYTNLTAVRDPETNEILLYNAVEVTEDSVNDPSKRRLVTLDHNGKFVNYR